MSILQPHQQINLGPFAHGAVLTFTAPKTDSIPQYPTLNGKAISLKNVPKKVTLTSGTVHTLAADTVAVTYTIGQAAKKSHNPPSAATLSLTLSKANAGTNPVIKNAGCEFKYTWDFVTGIGSAQLVSINKCSVGIHLYPIGLQGKLAFMSDMLPAAYVINGQRVVIYRVNLDINLADNAASAAVMFNQDGSCIEETPNFDSKSHTNTTDVVHKHKL